MRWKEAKPIIEEDESYIALEKLNEEKGVSGARLVFDELISVAKEQYRRDKRLILDAFEEEELVIEHDTHFSVARRIILIKAGLPDIINDENITKKIKERRRDNDEEDEDDIDKTIDDIKPSKDSALLFAMIRDRPNRIKEIFDSIQIIKITEYEEEEKKKLKRERKYIELLEDLYYRSDHLTTTWEDCKYDCETYSAYCNLEKRDRKRLFFIHMATLEEKMNAKMSKKPKTSHSESESRNTPVIEIQSNESNNNNNNDNNISTINNDNYIHEKPDCEIEKKQKQEVHTCNDITNQTNIYIEEPVLNKEKEEEKEREKEREKDQYESSLLPSLNMYIQPEDHDLDEREKHNKQENKHEFKKKSGRNKEKDDKNHSHSHSHYRKHKRDEYSEEEEEEEEKRKSVIGDKNRQLEGNESDRLSDYQPGLLSQVIPQKRDIEEREREKERERENEREKENEEGTREYERGTRIRDDDYNKDENKYENEKEKEESEEEYRKRRKREKKEKKEKKHKRDYSESRDRDRDRERERGKERVREKDDHIRKSGVVVVIGKEKVKRQIEREREREIVVVRERERKEEKIDEEIEVKKTARILDLKNEENIHILNRTCPDSNADTLEILYEKRERERGEEEIDVVRCYMSERRREEKKKREEKKREGEKWREEEEMNEEEEKRG
eukprot:CAMPEP_0182424368 /NCGR_PEP_ID=MMETSP1167-20130531/10576_1 /TAXON_ID=2988 /ORGANISM="Mallomonas Sp, Strain CCMP3275" /LENGTH=672 /DNA_ID=CAMNT_0024604133 /DNA_START=770 /DNA_END=2789 /DNA_ORIENTATION=+